MLIMQVTGNGLCAILPRFGTDILRGSARGEPEGKLMGWLLVRRICVVSRVHTPSAQEQQDTISKEGDAPGPCEHADTAAIRSSEPNT